MILLKHKIFLKRSVSYEKVCKKLISGALISATALTFSIMAVSAAPVVQRNVDSSTYSSIPLDRNYYFSSSKIPILHGNYQLYDGSHATRCNAVYNSGSLNGKALSNLYYNTKYKTNIKANSDGIVSGKGAMTSKWVTPGTNNYVSVSKLSLYGKKYNNNNELIIVDIIYVD